MLRQEDLDTLQHWSDKWLLQFHPDKCNVLTIGKPFMNYNYSLPNNTDGSRKIPEHVNESKDLGVLVDTNLNFESHINAKVNKANSILQ